MCLLRIGTFRIGSNLTATVTKQDLGASEEFFSKFSTTIPVIFYMGVVPLPTGSI